MKVVADQLAPWLPGRMVTLGPTASAAATTASTCGATSKSTPNRSPPPRSRGWRATASSTPRRPIAAFAELGVDTEKIDAARA